MNFFEVVHNRRSVRYFQEKEVPEESIDKIIDAARWAPTACNRQAYRFIRITDKSILRKLVEAFSSYYIEKSPVVILVCYSNRTDNVEYKDYIQSVGACIQNMQLAATALGLGAAWSDTLPPKGYVRKLLKIPWHYDPFAIVSIGYPAAKIMPLPRKHEVKDLISYNKFYFPKTDEYSQYPFFSKKNFRLMIKTFLRYVFFRLPGPIKKIVMPIARKMERRFDKYNIEV